MLQEVNDQLLFVSPVSAAAVKPAGEWTRVKEGEGGQETTAEVMRI